MVANRSRIAFSHSRTTAWAVVWLLFAGASFAVAADRSADRLQRRETDDQRRSNATTRSHAPPARSGLADAPSGSNDFSRKDKDQEKGRARSSAPSTPSRQSVNPGGGAIRNHANPPTNQTRSLQLPQNRDTRLSTPKFTPGATSTTPVLRRPGVSAPPVVQPVVPNVRLGAAAGGRGANTPSSNSAADDLKRRLRDRNNPNPGNTNPSSVQGRSTFPEIRNRLGGAGQGTPATGGAGKTFPTTPVAPGSSLTPGASTFPDRHRLPGGQGNPDAKAGGATATPKLTPAWPRNPQGADLPGITRQTPARTWPDVHRSPNMKVLTPGHPELNGGVDLTSAGKVRFPDRLKSGQLDPLTKGEVARKIQLGDQLKLHSQGDVARRLNLYNNLKTVKHVGPAKVNINNVAIAGGPHQLHHRPDLNYFPYHGRVSSTFAQSCFHSYYCGPGLYPHYCYYPKWSPWVDWSWHYHCHPFWDPRPIWCRPVLYEPCPVWIYYQPPAWVELPAAPCGTWVDVKPVAVAPEQYDLQLLAVRFVDPGHSEENLGPRYRVWFRNNSPLPITQPFSVIALASNDGNLRPDLPQAGVRVQAVDAGDTQSVDIRLPPAVAAMARGPDGTPLPFASLHVLVDANQEIPDVNKANNGVTLARDQVLPVDPATFEVEPKSGAAGSEVLLAGEGFGPQPGQVIVHLGGIEMQAEIVGWYDLGIRLNLPNLPLAAATQAELIVIRGDGAAANPIQVTILPAGAPAAAAPAPAAPAPPAPMQPRP